MSRGTIAEAAGYPRPEKPQQTAPRRAVPAGPRARLVQCAACGVELMAVVGAAIACPCCRAPLDGDGQVILEAAAEARQHAVRAGGFEVGAKASAQKVWGRR